MEDHTSLLYVTVNDRTSGDVGSPQFCFKDGRRAESSRSVSTKCKAEKAANFMGDKTHEADTAE